MAGNSSRLASGWLRSRGGHLVHCLNEAPQPNGTWIGCWLKLAHVIFRAETGDFNTRAPPQVPCAGGANAPCTNLGSPLTSWGFAGFMCRSIPVAARAPALRGCESVQRVFSARGPYSTIRQRS